jgi:hypothetical protein
MTSSADGFTIETSPTVTVGTVSFPRATERTNAASSGLSQMLRISYSTPLASRFLLSAEQNPHPGRQYIVTVVAMHPNVA